MFLMLIGMNAHAQLGAWQVLPNSPLAPYYHHDDITFINEDRGWLCNIIGQIFRTDDGGDSWTKQADMPGTSFRCIAFADSLRGWVGNLGRGGWNPTSDPNLLYQTVLKV